MMFGPQLRLTGGQVGRLKQCRRNIELPKEDPGEEKRIRFEIDFCNQMHDPLGRKDDSPVD
jgi:hypothetical protein